MQLTVTDDTADALFREILIQDYKSLIEQHKQLSDKLVTAPLRKFELEDLNDTTRWIEGIEIMMEYYIGYNWKETI
jgi:hypothetical protein